MSLPTIELEGLSLAAVTEAALVAHVIEEAAAGRGGWIVTVNLEILRRLRREAETRALVQEADLFTADGAPLVWATRIAGAPVPERVAGSSLVTSLSAGAAAAGLRPFLLGGDPGMAEAAAARLERTIPALTVAGTACPAPGFEREEGAMAALRAELRGAAPDLIYVGLGFPKQERLIAALRAELPSAWWIGVGISFSYLAGAVPRAPAWAQRAGIEWALRLAAEPRRLWRRYLVRGLPFGAGLLARAAWRRWKGKPPGSP